MDGMVGVDWGQVLTGFGILFVFITTIALLLVIYSITGGILGFSNPYFAIRKRGAIFAYLNLLWICCLIGSGLWNTYFN